MESRVCEPCTEFWACSAWGSCQQGMQVRECSDEHFCETAESKPVESRECNAQFTPGPEPARVINNPNTGYGQQLPASGKGQVAEKSTVLGSLWQKYSWYIGGGAALLFLIIVALLVFYFTRSRKQIVYNSDELKQWVIQEKKMGTSDADIRQILAQNTGWKAEEINKILNDLPPFGKNNF